MSQPVRAEFIVSAAGPTGFPAESLPEVAFLGRSNVGKSSLLNQLVGQKGLAFVSSTPGRTQSINFYRVAEELHFVDLPGYGYARVPTSIKQSWQGLIERYLLHRHTLRLCVILLDARRGWMDKDRELRQWLQFHQKPLLVVATKIDKLSQQEQKHGLDAIRQEAGECDIVPFSAHTGRGARELWQAIWKIRNRQ